MRKRGVVWESMTRIGVWLIVLVVMVTAITPLIFPQTRSFFKIGEEKVKTVSTGGDFEPYVPLLSKDEMAVEKSMNRLIAGIRKVADPSYAIPPDLTGQATGVNEECDPKEEVCPLVCDTISSEYICCERNVGGQRYYAYRMFCTTPASDQECAMINKPSENNLGGQECVIKGFELPQEMADTGYIEQFISGVLDPQYLLYYEVFPEGEDHYWHMDAFSFAPGMIVASAISTFVFGAGKEIDSAIDIARTASKSGRIAKAVKSVYADKALWKMLRGGRFGYRFVSNLIAKFPKPKAKALSRLEDELVGFALDNPRFAKYIDGSQEELLTIFAKHVDDSGKLGKQASKRLDRDLTQFFKKKGLGKNTKVKSNSIAQRLRERVSATLAKDVSDEVVSGIQQFKGLVRKITKSAGGIDDKALETLLRKGDINLENLKKLKASGVLKQGDIEKIFDTAIEISKSAPNAFVGAAGKKLDKAIGQATMEMAERSAAKHGGLTDKITKSFSTLAKGTSISVINPVAGGAYFVGKGTAGALRFANKHRLAVLLTMGFVANLKDGQNEKFLSKGKDNIYLDIPRYVQGVERSLDVPEISPYYLNMQKDDGKASPFHLVSPCKTDLYISKTMMKAERSKAINAYDVFDFDLGGSESALVDVKKGSILYPEPEVDISNCPLDPVDYTDGTIFQSDLIDGSQICNGKRRGAVVLGQDKSKFCPAYADDPDYSVGCNYLPDHCYLGCVYSQDIEKLSAEADALIKLRDELLGDPDDGEVRTEDLIGMVDHDRINDLYNSVADFFDRYYDWSVHYDGEYLDVVNEVISAFHSPYHTDSWSDSGEGALSSKFYRKSVFPEIDVMMYPQGSVNKLKELAQDCLDDEADCDYDQIYRTAVDASAKSIKYVSIRNYPWDEVDYGLFSQTVALACQKLDKIISTKSYPAEVEELENAPVPEDENSFSTSLSDSIGIEYTIADPDALYVELELPENYFERVCRMGLPPSILDDLEFKDGPREYVPRFAFGEKGLFFGVNAPLLPTFDTYETYMRPITGKMQQYIDDQGKFDAFLANADYEDLIYMKRYLEAKESYLGEDFNEGDSKGDLSRWIQVSMRLQTYENVDESNAIKAVSEGKLYKTGFLESSSYAFPVINIRPDMSEYGEGDNYCYHSSDLAVEYGRWLVLGAGLVLDKVAGVAAGAACAPYTLGVGATICARGAQVAVDVAASWGEYALDQEYKWPSHGN